MDVVNCNAWKTFNNYMYMKVMQLKRLFYKINGF